MESTQQYLENEIERLRTELAVTIPQEIQAAVELGDLRENSEYSSAIAKQHFVSVRLEQLSKRLQAYTKIDLSKLPRDAANVGSTVKLRNLKTNEIVHVKIVIGDTDENSKYQEVTINSPMGQALKNKKIKEEFVVQLPVGSLPYRILQISTIHDN